MTTKNNLILFVFIIGTLSLTGCTSSIESTDLPTGVKSWFQNNLNDPESFELIGSEEINVNNMSQFFGDFENALKYINTDYLDEGANLLVKYRTNNNMGSPDLRYTIFIMDGNEVLQAKDVNPVHLNKK